MGGAILEKSLFGSYFLSKNYIMYRYQMLTWYNSISITRVYLSLYLMYESKSSWQAQNLSDYENVNSEHLFCIDIALNEL